VATWNINFLPLTMLNNPRLYRVTVELASRASQAVGGSFGSNGDMLVLVVTGPQLFVSPLVIALLLLQRYWQSGSPPVA